MIINFKNSFAGGILMVGALTLAACSPPGEQDSQMSSTELAEATVASSTAATETSATDDSDADSPLSISDAVVRASVEDNPMTSIFGTIVNNAEDEVTVTGFTASVDAARYEIHEVVDGVMQQKEGGIVIAAQESHELAPGGDHLMIMGLAAPVEAGDTVAITLQLDDGSEVELEPIAVRTIAAGDESYGEDGNAMGHDGVDHSAH